MTPLGKKHKTHPTVRRSRGQVHSRVVLASCQMRGEKTALIDTSCTAGSAHQLRRICGTGRERGSRPGRQPGLQPGDRIGIFLPNCWEFGVAFHAATAGRRDSDDAEPHVSRARGALSTRDLRRGRADHRWHAAQRNQPVRAPELRNVFTTAHAPRPADPAVRIPAANARQAESAESPNRFPARRWQRFPSPAAPPDCPKA